MAHIQKRGPKKWKARYRAPDGRERSRTFERRVDADKWLTSQQAKKAEGTWVDPRLSKVTFEEWATLWWPATAALKPKTRAGYESLLRSQLLPEFGTTQLGRIDPLHVHRWVAALRSRGLSPSRIRQAHGLLAMMLRAAVSSGYIGRDPSSGVKLPRTSQREMHVLDPEEVRALAEAIVQPYGVFVYRLGLRRPPLGRGLCTAALTLRSTEGPA